MKEETLNKIDRYLRGEMTDREKNAFENILAGDDALRQRVELMKDIILDAPVRVHRYLRAYHVVFN